MKRFAVPLVSLMLVLAGCGNDSPYTATRATNDARATNYTHATGYPTADPTSTASYPGTPDDACTANHTSTDDRHRKFGRNRYGTSRRRCKQYSHLCLLQQ